MDELDRYARLIEERRSRTPFREFVKEIASWTAIGIYRTQGKVSKYPASDRIGQLTESGTVFDASLAEACARDYDHAESFFGNLAKLFREVPLQPTMQFGSNENTEFSDSVFGAKDVYLSFVAGMEASEIAYSAFAYLRVDRVFGSFFVTQDCSNVYSSAGVSKSFEIFYSRYISGCSDMWFCSNCTGCSSCLLCDGLTNQRYCIENVAYDRGTYEAKRREILADKASFAGRYREICRTARGANVASERVK